MRKPNILGIGFALCVGLSAPASASGFHYEIDVTSQLVGDTAGNLTGLRMQWLYDPKVSALMLEDEDTGEAQRAATLKVVSERMMSDLHKNRYFTRLFLGEQSLQVVAVTDYHLDLTPDMQLRLEFLLPLLTPQSLAGTRLDINMVDPTGAGILLFRMAHDVSTGAVKSDCAIAIEAHPDFAHGQPAQTVHIQCH